MQRPTTSPTHLHEQPEILYYEIRWRGGRSSDSLTRIFPVRTDKNGIITHAAPILRWSLGRQIEELTEWVLTQPDGEVELLPF